MISTEIKNRIASQRLLGYTTMKHIQGYYVSTETTSNRTNVYNEKFEALLVGINLVDISHDFILVREKNEVTVYSRQAKPLYTTNKNERVNLTDNIVYVYFNENVLLKVIKPNGEIVEGVPNGIEIICQVSKQGHVYTLDSNRNLYRGKELIASGIAYNSHFSDCYYAKYEGDKVKVYDLDTNKVVFEHDRCDIQIAKDKILLEVAGPTKQFYLYDNGLKQLNFYKYVTEIGFICDIFGNPKMIICRKGSKYRLANMNGEILVAKDYHSIDVKMYGNYVRLQNIDHNELRDINGKLALEATQITPTEYGMIVANNGATIILECEELEQL